MELIAIEITVEKIRELTNFEKKCIRELVKQCTNYDRNDKSCLHIDCEDTSSNECYMLGKYYSGHMCQYFEKAILPLDPILEHCLMHPTDAATIALTKGCSICGGDYKPINNRQKYCSDKCAKDGNRIMSRQRMKRSRS